VLGNVKRRISIASEYLRVRKEPLLWPVTKHYSLIVL